MNATEYCQAPPPRGLEAVVECLWWMRAPPVRQDSAERVLPDGCLEVVFHLGGGCERVSPRGWRGQPEGLFVGPMTSHAVIRSLGQVDLVGVRLKAAGAAALVETPLTELRDASVPISVLDTRLPLDLWEKLGNAKSQGERLKILGEALLRAGRLERIDSRTAALCREMRSSGGSLPVERLADLAGISTRTLERIFRSQLGLSPKMLSRIIRLQQVIRQADSPTPASLRDAALDAGYYDQAHFLKDFKAFAGVSPTTFYALEANRMSEAFRATPSAAL